MLVLERKTILRESQLRTKTALTVERLVIGKRTAQTLQNVRTVRTMFEQLIQKLQILMYVEKSDVDDGYESPVESANEQASEAESEGSLYADFDTEYYTRAGDSDMLAMARVVDSDCESEDVDFEIEIIFEWSFQYVEGMNIWDAGMWHIILYVENSEWADLIMPAEADISDQVYWFSLCHDDELD